MRSVQRHRKVSSPAVPRSPRHEPDDFVKALRGGAAARQQRADGQHVEGLVQSAQPGEVGHATRRKVGDGDQLRVVAEAHGAHGPTARLAALLAEPLQRRVRVQHHPVLDPGVPAKAPPCNKHNMAPARTSG